MKLLIFLLFFQSKDTIPTMCGIFYYKDGSVVYMLKPQRTIIATMNQRYTRAKLDSVWICNRGGAINRAKPVKSYKFVRK
jgi:hypothetical protein